MAKDGREVSTSGLVDTKPGSETKRRRWSEAERRQIVAETHEPGQSVSIVARRHDVNANQLFKWRRQMVAKDRPGRVTGMVPVTIAERSAVTEPVGTIEIELGTGTRVRIVGRVDPGMVSAVLGALGSRR